jgi:hypothetical protein
LAERVAGSRFRRENCPASRTKRSLVRTANLRSTARLARRRDCSSACRDPRVTTTLTTEERRQPRPRTVAFWNLRCVILCVRCFRPASCCASWRSGHAGSRPCGRTSSGRRVAHAGRAWRRPRAPCRPLFAKPAARADALLLGRQSPLGTRSPAASSSRRRLRFEGSGRRRLGASNEARLGAFGPPFLGRPLALSGRRACDAWRPSGLRRMASVGPATHGVRREPPTDGAFRPVDAASRRTPGVRSVADECG